MKGGTAGKIYKVVRAELEKMVKTVFMKQLKKTDIAQLHRYVIQHHLREASVPKKMVFQSFFYDVVHSKDSIYEILDFKQR